MKKVSVLLVHEQGIFADNFKVAIETRARDIRVIAVAHDGEHAVLFVQKVHPDVVLVEIKLPGMDGLEATRIITETCPDVKVMVLTRIEDPHCIRSALKYGVVGYIRKGMETKELIAAIRSVCSGKFFVSSFTVASQISCMIEDSQSSILSSLDLLAKWYQELSRREREILDCICKGYTNKETARKLSIAVQTVKNHVSTIYDKIGIHDRLKLIHYKDTSSRKEINLGVELPKRAIELTSNAV